MSTDRLLDFNGHRVLVTGGSRGIGRAVSRLFADRGARVAVHYRQNAEAAQATVAEMPGGPHLRVAADIRQPDAVAAMVDQVVAEFGGVDVLVNNAGIFEPHPLADVDYSRWQRSWSEILATNLVGAANVSYCVARRMIDQGQGRIVNVSSRGAFRGEPRAPAYGASKAGLNAMSQSLARHLAPYNIFVGVVAPGYVETDMAAESLQGAGGDAIRRQSPLGRVARPEEVAYAVVFLASAGAEFMTGCIVDVNGASYLRT